MDKSSIESHLSSFTGTTEWTRYSPLFPNVLLTEGAVFVAKECQAFWLMDAICSHLHKVKDPFVVVKLVITGTQAVLTLANDDPPDDLYASQEIEYTDFPLDEIKLYAINDGVYWVILLPSEY